MGQYYVAVNLDKKEYIYPHTYGCGAKLMEHSYMGNDGFGNDFTGALITLLTKDWAGDRIVLAGDYANKEYMEENFPELFEELAKENPWLNDKREYNGDYYDMALYECDEHDFKPIDGITQETACPKYALFTNGEHKYYCDLYDERMFAWDWTDEYTGEKRITNIFPVNLLVALGNGLGGGDYHGLSEELVGCLAGYHIELDDEIPEGYEDVFDGEEPFREN